jgi:hypothetical protein
MMLVDIDRVPAEREKTGERMLGHGKILSFHWSVTAEELRQVKRERCIPYSPARIVSSETTARDLWFGQVSDLLGWFKQADS